MKAVRAARSLCVTAVVGALMAVSAPAMAAPDGTGPEQLTESEPNDGPTPSRTPHHQPVTDDDRQLTGDAPAPQKTRPANEEPGPTEDQLPTTGEFAATTSELSSLDATVVDPNAPVGVPDAYATANDQVLSVAAPGFLGNDIDLDGEALTATVIADNVDHGTLAAFASGSFTYTPNAGFVGIDTFQYRMRDAAFNTSDPVTVTITVLDPNVPPVAGDDAYAAVEDTPLVVGAPGVLDNDVDANGDPLTVVANTAPSYGTVTVQVDGAFTYTPDGNVCGVDTFEYTVSDDSGATDTATVTITVACVNDPPVAVDDAYTTKQDTLLDVPASDGVLVRGDDDSDVDGDPISVAAFDATTAFGGDVSMEPDGAFTYTPAPGFAGLDTFTYTITDGQGGSDTAVVTITVAATDNRSIEVQLLEFELVDDVLGGQVMVTNQTSSGAPVQVLDVAMEVEYRAPGDRKWTAVAVTDGSCQIDPSPTFVVTDQALIDVSGCLLDMAVPEASEVRVTARVRIFGVLKGKGHSNGWFESRLTSSS
jgi:VCBS repeat-containing protein